jgi:uncharacterized protein YbaR (Trm112 family)
MAVVEIPDTAKQSTWRTTMPLSKDLLEILACPQCKGKIVPDEKHEKLTCATCKLVYPVRDDIPVMLVDEALPLE